MTASSTDKRAIVARLVHPDRGEVIGYVPILYFPATVYRTAMWGCRIVRCDVDVYGRARDWPAWAYLATPEEALTLGDPLAIWPSEREACAYAWQEWGATYEAPLRSWEVRGEPGPEVLL